MNPRDGLARPRLAQRPARRRRRRHERGTVGSSLADDFSAPSGACIEQGDIDTTSTDATVLASDEILYFVVVPLNPCGHGSAGSPSSGPPRPIGACP